MQSSYRIGFIIQSIVLFIGLCGITYIVVLALEDDGTEFWMNENRNILGLGAILWIWGGYIYVGFRTMQSIMLTSNQIEIRKLFGKIEKYEYSKITSTKIHKITSSYSWTNSGFEKLNLELSDNSIIIISENMYDNYLEMKSFVYKQL